MWYCHPDTMAMARARHKADKATSLSMHSLAWKKAYREAYSHEDDYGTERGRDSLHRYIAELDAEIVEQEKTMAGEEKAY